MLKTIYLKGFKDQSRTMHLGRLNLLVGRNGLGKSAFIEGLVYALSGRVPGGKSKDEVAKCFSPRGGKVQVIDEEGRWIMRGITVDHKATRVSEVLETEPKEAPTSTSIWDCNQALMDFRHFVDLSSAKRRDFMLDLVGAAGGKLTLEKGRETLLAGFAKELGGKGADESCILDPRKLPEDLRPVAAQWKPIWDYIESFDWPGTDASEALTSIVDTAKTKKNEARAASKEAKASLSELTVETRGAEIAAGEYDAANKAKEDLERRKTEASSRVEHIDSIKARVDRGRIEAGRLEKARGTLQTQRDESVKVAEPEGELVSVEAEEEVLRSKIDEGARLAREFNDHTERVFTRDHQVEQIEIYKRAIAAHQNQPMGHMLDAVAAFEIFVPEEGGAQVHFDDLKTACEEVAAAWKVILDGQIARYGAEQEKLDGMNRVLAQDSAVPTEADLARLRGEVDILKSNVARLRAENDDWSARVGAAHADQKKRASMDEDLARHDERIKATVEALTTDLAALVAAGEAPDVVAITAERDAAAEVLERLNRLKGSLDAFDGAKERAEASTAKDAAWTAFERAAVDARETYVAALSEPIKADVGVLLSASGLDERPYLELENARGRPVFDLGWEVGDSRRSLNALSHGEATIFGAAVAVAIARRARGRKLLLVEADRIDIETLEDLLKGLLAIEDAFDAVMVSTHTQMIVPPVGWRVHEFDALGGLTSRNITENQAETTERLVGKIGEAQP